MFELDGQPRPAIRTQLKAAVSQVCGFIAEASASLISGNARP